MAFSRFCQRLDVHKLTYALATTEKITTLKFSLLAAHWKTSSLVRDSKNVRPYSKMSTKVPELKLNNGRGMPVIGLGTFQCKDEEIRASLNAALECGYRHIDTAALYMNEHVIGEVLNEWITSGKVKREDLFITTKLPPGGNRPNQVSKFLDDSLKKLKLAYVDLYLIHTPFTTVPEFEGDMKGKELDHSTDLEGVYKEMAKQVEAGKAKAIGLSNFNSKQIERMIKVSHIKPANLQVEVHAYHQQKPLRAFCHQNGITVCAYAPLGAPYIQGDDSDKYPPLIAHPVVTSIAQRVNRTPAQVLLRFLLQGGLIVIPKSSKLTRVKENFQLLDFELSKSDMAALEALDRAKDNNAGRLFALKNREGIKNHPEYPYSIPF